MKRAINEADALEVQLRRSERAVDYAAPVSLTSINSDGTEDDVFRGTVESAVPRGDGVAVRETTALALLHEQLLGAMDASGLSRYERFYSVAAIAGVDNEDITVEDSPGPKVEEMIVSVPVDGVSLTERVTLGSVRLEPVEAEGASTDKRVAEFRMLDDRDISVIATSEVSASLLIDAERSGLQAIHAALDALLATNLYSLSRTPNGELVPYTRDCFRARPKARPIVIVHGLQSGRRWVRSIKSRPSHTALDAAEIAGLWPELDATDVPTELRSALASLRHAADECDTDRTQSITLECH